jgi:hypothetical protein
MAFVSSVAHSAEMAISEHESYLLLDNLLSFTDTTGNHKMQLEQYKEWGKLYRKLVNQKRMTKTDLKLFLLMGFIADERTKIEPQEEIAKDIMPVFTAQPTIILNLLKELPFLIGSTCNSLNSYFELTSKGDEKQQFIRKYEGEITATLGKDAPQCLAKIK